MGTDAATAEEANPRGRLTGLGPFLLLIAGAALWVDFGKLAAGYRDDTLIFPLASVYAWSPFFWEQDRIGMLTPLLCSPVKDPWRNLQLEVFLTGFMGLSVPLLAVEYGRPGPAGRWAAVVGVAVMLGFGPPVLLNNVLHECCYPQALFLALVGLLVFDSGGPRPARWRYVVCLACFALAHWQYLGALLGVGGLIVGRSWLKGSGVRRVLQPVLDSHARRALLLLLAGFVSGVWTMILAAPASPDYQPLPGESTPPDQWVPIMTEIAWRLYDPDSYAGQPWLLALGVIAVGGLVAATRQRDAWAALAGSAVLLVAGFAEIAAVSTRDWPTQNEYHTRYVLGASLYLGPAAALPLVAAVIGGLGPWGRRAAAVVAIVGLFAAAGWQYGWPSPANARGTLDATVGQYTDELHAAGADAVGGQYWQVWTSVFHANVVRHDRGDGKPVVGVAYRSWVWKPVWEAHHPDGMKVAVFRGPNNYRRFAASCKMFGLTEPKRVGESATFDLYFVRPTGKP